MIFKERLLKQEKATLEDLFLNYFGERAGESNDEI